MTDDPRFSVIHTDPRFARAKRKDVKVPLDSRFKAAFKSKEFIDQRKMCRLSRANVQPVLIDMEGNWRKMRAND